MVELAAMVLTLPALPRVHLLLALPVRQAARVGQAAWAGLAVPVGLPVTVARVERVEA